MGILKLYGKMIITAKLEIVTGLHISTSNDFAAIGAVDEVVIRDPQTHQPIIPGSSIKGKMRYLASRITTDKKEIVGIKDESDELKRLFGNSKGNDGVILSRLQYYDLKLNSDSKKMLDKLDLDLPYTEVKFENTINRINGVANPRQLERVPAGAIFDFKLVYNIEKLDEIKDDLELLKNCFEVLEQDYLGGHGTRGYGKVIFKEFKSEIKNYSQEEISADFNYKND